MLSVTERPVPVPLNSYPESVVTIGVEEEEEEEEDEVVTVITIGVGAEDDEDEEHEDAVETAAMHRSFVWQRIYENNAAKIIIITQRVSVAISGIR